MVVSCGIPGLATGTMLDRLAGFVDAFQVNFSSNNKQSLFVKAKLVNWKGKFVNEMLTRLFKKVCTLKWETRQYILPVMLPGSVLRFSGERHYR